MPDKKRKRRSKKKQEVKWDFDFQFDDLTMIEADGEYDRVKELMDEDVAGGWRTGSVKTRLTIVSQFGECNFKLDFYPDRKVFIIAYVPSTREIYNPDLRCLSRWCQANGWNIPQPIGLLLRNNLQFWKLMWKTNLVDSDELDERFGIRPDYQEFDPPKEVEDE